MQIKISEINYLNERIKFINAQKLEDIEFIDDNNSVINIEKSRIDEFKYCGLSNSYFITTGFYKSGFSEE